MPHPSSHSGAVFKALRNNVVLPPLDDMVIETSEGFFINLEDPGGQRQRSPGPLAKTSLVSKSSCYPTCHLPVWEWPAPSFRISLSSAWRAVRMSWEAPEVSSQQGSSPVGRPSDHLLRVKPRLWASVPSLICGGGSDNSAYLLVWPCELWLWF